MLFIGALFLGVFLPRVSVRAQEEHSGITISPAFQEVTLHQGEKEAGFSVSLTNNIDVPVTLRVAALDFGSLDESGGVAFLGTESDLQKKYALASWLRLGKEVFTIEPFGKEEVEVVIENRDTLAPGGHYGALTFKTEYSGQRTNTGDTVSVNQLFSTLIFLKKVGGDIYQLGLKGWEYDHHLFQFQDTPRLRFENSGNVHAVPRGKVIVTDPLGREVAKGIINEESALILPETTRVYPVRLRQLLRNIIPGRYTVEITYRYDGKDDFTTTSFSFDFIPPLAMLGLLVFIATCGWYVAQLRRRMGEKKALSRSQKSKRVDA